MRKVAILFVAFFVSGALFAQSNLSTTTQTGTDHMATVDQAGLSNTSEIIQDQGFSYGTANGSTAEIEQTGELNSSYVNSWGWNHEVYTTQTGDENTAGVKQSGGQNDAFIDQTGDRNTVRGLGAGSDAFQKAGDPFGLDKSMFDIVQIGDENTVGMWQEHSAEATVLQEGYQNRSEVKQTGPVGGAVNIVDVDQDGSMNIGETEQYGDGNESRIRQQHTGNEAYQYTDGDDNFMSSNVHGTYNYTEQTQLGDGNWSYTGASPSAKVNDIFSYQEGDGNGDYVRISGSGSEGNILNVEQTGSFNKSYSWTIGDFNTIDVLQDGDGNISGTGNTSASLGITQTGDMNAASLMQLSDFNTSKIVQAGSSNTATITQD